jgi:predicted MFS family arabinose efflux permease
VKHSASSASARALMRTNADYRLWWTGSLINSLGTAVSTLAYPLLILRLTGSPLWAGVVAALQDAPFALMSLPVGVLVDRARRRWLLVCSSTVSALATASIPAAYLAGALTIGQIIAVALINGTAAVFYSISSSASLPRLVAKDQLGVAASQAETIWGLSATVGPSLAGLLITDVWLGAPFVVDAASFLVAAACILRVRTQLGANRPYPALEWRKDLLAGARTIRDVPFLRSITILTVCGDALFSGVGLLVIMLIRLKTPLATPIGLVATAAAVGGITGSLVANHVERRVGFRRAVVAKHWVTAALFPPLAIGLFPALIGLIWASISFMVSIMNVIQMKYTVSVIRDEVLGRAQSFLTFASYGSLPIGAALTGFALHLLGPRGTVGAYSAVLLLLAIYATASRNLRRGPGSRQPDQPDTARTPADVALDAHDGMAG